MRRLLLALAAAAPLAAQAREQVARPERIPDAARSRIRDRCTAELAKVFERSSFPGGSAALVLRDGSEVTFTVGVSSKETETPMKPAHRMLSGSIGKTYVAAAVLHLVAAGELDLDRRAASFFEDDDWFTRLPNAKTITLRHLLRHQTGIPRHILVPGFLREVLAEGKEDRVWKPKELLAWVFDKEPRFPAGEGWAYADTNFVIAGMILERVAGTTMYAYVQKHLLGPHGLKDTVPSDRRRIPGLVQGYTGLMRGMGFPPRVLRDGLFCVNPQFEWCGGGFCSTPLDLARWARVLYTGKAFAGKYLEAMLESVPATAYFGPKGRYGLGVIVRETPVGRLLGHDGVFPGYGSTMGYFPKLGVAGAVQVNRDGQRAVAVPLFQMLVRFARVVSDEAERGR